MENGNNKIPSDPEQKKTNSGGWERFLGGGDKASGADPVQGRAEQDPAAEAEDDALSFEKKEAERKNNSIGCVSTISYVIFVLGISIILSVFVILSVNDMFSFVKADKTAEITITDGESLRDVSKVLSKAGIIKYPSLFSTFAKLTDMDDDIAPGTYTLNASMDYRTILSNIRYKSAGKATVTITIPEGMEQDKIFALLEENGVASSGGSRPTPATTISTIRSSKASPTLPTAWRGICSRTPTPFMSTIRPRGCSKNSSRTSIKNGASR